MFLNKFVLCVTLVPEVHLWDRANPINTVENLFRWILSAGLFSVVKVETDVSTPNISRLQQLKAMNLSVNRYCCTIGYLTTDVNRRVRSRWNGADYSRERVTSCCLTSEWHGHNGLCLFGFPPEARVFTDYSPRASDHFNKSVLSDSLKASIVWLGRSSLVERNGRTMLSRIR